LKAVYATIILGERIAFMTKTMKKKLLTLTLLPLLFSCDFSFGSGETETLEIEPEAITDITALHSLYTGKFLIGNVISPSETTGSRFTYLKHHFNVLTAENAMKPDQVQKIKGTFTYPDAMIDAALAAGFKIHGHTLVWHSQSPAWMTTGVSKETAIANMQEHVTTVMNHYKGKIISWDVVNEAIDLPNSGGWDITDWKSCLRKNTGHVSAADNSAWYGAIGPEFVELAFLAARAADPVAKLYYNDFSLDNQDKARAVYNMVMDINGRHTVGGRKLIEGVGMQAHYNIWTDPNNVKKSIELFISAGVEVSISELDIQAVNLGYGTLSEADALLRQGSLYATLFTIFQDHAANISRVTFWGLDDTHSWRAASKPLLFDGNYKAKPAFYGVENPTQFLRDHPL
jgi:endo-1,4-beta-xylanase